MRARLCIQPSRAQLAHAGIDERVAGHPFLPGGEAVADRRASGRRGGACPRPASRAARRGAGRRSRASRAAARTAVSAPLPCAHGERPRRDAAEVQVRREPRGRVGGDRVVTARAVAVEMLPEPRARPLDAGRSRRRAASLVLNHHEARRAAAATARQAGRIAPGAGPAIPTAPPTRRGGRARTPGSGRCRSGRPRPQERRSCRRRGGGRARPRAGAAARRAYGLTSALAKTVVAPTARAARTVSATTSPRRTSSAPPSRRSDGRGRRATRAGTRDGGTPRRSACRRCRRRARTAAAPSRRPRAAAASAGLSWTRRSRVKRTTATCTAIGLRP